MNRSAFSTVGLSGTVVFKIENFRTGSKLSDKETLFGEKYSKFQSVSLPRERFWDLQVTKI